MAASSARSAPTWLSSAAVTESILDDKSWNSLATRAKPLPSSPARAATIMALIDSILAARFTAAISPILAPATVLSRSDSSRIRSGLRSASSRDIARASPILALAKHNRV